MQKRFAYTPDFDRLKQAIIARDPREIGRVLRRQPDLAQASDALGNNATLTLPSPGAAGSLGANKDIAIDGIAPTVSNATFQGVLGSSGPSLRKWVNSVCRNSWSPSGSGVVDRSKGPL